MRRKRFSEGQILSILKESAAGMKTSVVSNFSACHPL